MVGERLRKQAVANCIDCGSYGMRQPPVNEELHSLF
jgi:hypothetical protein